MMTIDKAISLFEHYIDVSKSIHEPSQALEAGETILAAYRAEKKWADNAIREYAEIRAKYEAMIICSGLNPKSDNTLKRHDAERAQ